MNRTIVVEFCFLQNHKIADISNKFSSHYDVVEQQLKSSTIGKFDSVTKILLKSTQLLYCALFTVTVYIR